MKKIFKLWLALLICSLQTISLSFASSNAANPQHFKKLKDMNPVHAKLKAALNAPHCKAPFTMDLDTRTNKHFCFANIKTCADGYLFSESSTSQGARPVCFKAPTPDKCPSFPGCYDRQKQSSGTCECILSGGNKTCPPDYVIDITKTTCEMFKKCEPGATKIALGGSLYCGFEPCKYLREDAFRTTIKEKTGCRYNLTN